MLLRLCHLNSVITAITESIKVRFGSVLASHLFCWLSPEMRDDMRRSLLQEALALEQQQSPLAVREDDNAKSDDSDESFFIFDNDKSPSDSTAQSGVSKYLEDSDIDVQSLRTFPIIKKLLMKYNTTLPSSAV